MKPAPIKDAERIAKTSGATRLMILGIDDDCNFFFTTYGATRAQCRALAKWADANAPYVAKDMNDA